MKKAIWTTAKIVAAAGAIIGAIGAPFSAVELYLVLSGSVVPGQPIYVDTLAPTALQSTRSLLISVTIMGLAFALSRFAHSRLHGGPNQSFKPTPSARLN